MRCCNASAQVHNMLQGHLHRHVGLLGRTMNCLCYVVEGVAKLLALLVLSAVGAQTFACMQITIYMHMFTAWRILPATFAQWMSVSKCSQILVSVNLLLVQLRTQLVAAPFHIHLITLWYHLLPDECCNDAGNVLCSIAAKSVHMMQWPDYQLVLNMPFARYTVHV